MLAKFTNNKNLAHFFIYSASYLGYGTLITSLGPMIPYFSFKTGRIETDYSFLFFYRSVGMILGALTLGFWKQFLNYHQIIACSSVLILIFCALFTMCIDNTLLQGVFILLSNMFQMIMEIVINICILAINPSHQIQFWMLLTHGVFGIGGLIGPILVYLFEQNTMLFEGILVFLVIPFYLKLWSPDQKATNELTQPVLEIKPQVTSTKQLTLSVEPSDILMKARKSGINMLEDQRKNEKQDNKPVKYVSYFTQNIIAVSLFLYIGLENGYGGWISSYAVLSEVFTKEEATKLPSIYWVCITVGRIGTAFISLKTSEKLRLVTDYGIITTIACIILIKAFGLVQFTCYLSAIFLGLCYSVMYPLILSLPMQFGLDLNSHQTSKIIMIAATAEGIISMAVGYLMEWFNINFMFYSLIFIKIIYWINNQQIIKNLQAEEVKPTEMELK